MNIIIAGSSGLIGSLLLKRVMGHDLTLIGRRGNSAAPGDARQIIGDHADWSSLMAGILYDIAICMLGSTMAQAGSKAAFAAVDHGAVIAFAQAAYAAGARQFMMVSSVGANPKAGNFYLATKGQSEAGVRAIGFERVDIFRPGLLRGQRGNDRRLAERLMIKLSPITKVFTPPIFDRYRAINAADVADAMAGLVGKPDHGVFVHHNREMLPA
mgnify:CR=1 FL=1